VKEQSIGYRNIPNISIWLNDVSDDPRFGGKGWSLGSATMYTCTVCVIVKIVYCSSVGLHETSVVEPEPEP
jgi:hypothetical protein